MALSHTRRWSIFIGSILSGAILANGWLFWHAYANGGPNAIPDAYARALQWDESQVRKEASQVLDWQSAVSWVPSEGGTLEFTIKVTDHAGISVLPDDMQATLTRPSDARIHLPCHLQAKNDGFLTGHVVLPRPGLWTLELKLSRGDDYYEITRRLVLP